VVKEIFIVGSLTYLKRVGESSVRGAALFPVAVVPLQAFGFDLKPVGEKTNPD
jgi:hypothetical protein